MITKKAQAIQAAKALQPKVAKKSTSKKGSRRQPCTHPDHHIRCISYETGARRCHCGKDFPKLEDCDHPISRRVYAKRIGYVGCEKCGATLKAGVPADKYGDSLK
jgi:hypothetical protein